MKRVFTIPAVLFLCLVWFSVVVSACTCVVYKPSEAFERSSEVFIGKVKETGGWINPYAVFKVEKSWKSIETDEITVYLSTSCGGMTLTEGAEYLVYTYDYKGASYTGVCSGTAEIESAEKDLQYL